MGRPRLYSDEERREKRRLKYRKWRSENLERAREIVRNSMKRATDRKAIAEGREPGRIGRTPIPLSIEEKRAKQNERVKRYYRENLETSRQHGANVARNRRARIREVGGTHSVDDIKALRARQKGKCAFCLQRLGRETPDVDHYLPLVRGGSNDPSNLRLLHKTCNRSKGAKHPLEFGLRNGLLCW